MTAALVGLVQSHGVLAILFLMAAESCGLPIPSELVMPLAGALSAGGHLPAALSLGAGAVGNLIGSVVAYALAARFGRAAMIRVGRRVGLSERHLESAEGWFRQHGLGAVFVGRLLPVIRTYISFPAGLARVNPIGFVVLTLAGAIPWNAALFFAGYLLGDAYRVVDRPIQLAAIPIGLTVVAILVRWYLRGRRRQGDRRHTQVAGGSESKA
ncbi:MAG: DedA family protein [Trebonia sp.]